MEQARRSLEENWMAFLAARDAYLDAAKLSLATRRDILQAELEARQNLCVNGGAKSGQWAE